jgi:protein N-terminal methyltransferase
MYQTGLQDFDPRKPENSVQVGDIIGAEDGWEAGYDVVWIQWCAGHLSDEQFVIFLQRSKDSLREDGIIVVKENQTRYGAETALFDDDDSSLTRYGMESISIPLARPLTGHRNYHRSEENLKSIFAKAGLKVIREELQLGFPTTLFPVKMYGLR